MQFRLGAVIEFGATIVSGIVGITMAYTGYGVWSLVGLGLSRELSRTIAAWLVSDWRPKGRFSVSSVKSMWSYCSLLLYSSIFHHIVTNLHTFIIGKIFPPAELGLYARAIGLQALPVGLVSGVVQRVAFPLFSKHQTDKILLLQSIRKQIRLLVLGVSLMMGLLASLAAELVPWLLGQQWLEAIPLLQILCAAGILNAAFPMHSEMTKALGKSAIFFRVEIAKKLMILIILAVVYRYGIKGFAWGAVAISVTDYYLSASPSKRLIGYNWLKQIRDLIPSILLAGVSSAILFYTPWDASWSLIEIMLAKACLFLLISFIQLFIFRKLFFQEAWGIFGIVFKRINKIFFAFSPATLKVKIKNLLLNKLHAKPEITSRIATRVLRDGLPRYLDWTYESEKQQTLAYLESMRVGPFAYKFAGSSEQPTLYGSIYACMLLSMYGVLDSMTPAEKNDWLTYLDSFQDAKDGYFRDPVLACPAFEGTPEWGDGWGARHLAGLIIVAYGHLGRSPKYPFTFLEPYYDLDYLNIWLKSFAFKQDVWSQSNYIMNIATLLQYARDYMGENRAAPAIKVILEWLRSTQRADTGMWHQYTINGYPEIGDAIRGAYHFYPLFVYENEPLKHPEAIIDTILRSQNSWGGFNPQEMPSGACEDIDAIEPLIRASLQTGYRQLEVNIAIRRAMLWVLSCRNKNGGYESLPENGCPHGNHLQTSSMPGEGNLFSTWFRTLCLAYILDFLKIPNAFTLRIHPGYEINLNYRK